MAMIHRYGLHPWIWSDADKCHARPDRVVGAIDFRPEELQATPGQSGGFGFFDWPGDGNFLPSDAIPLGEGDCREIVVSPAQRAELKTRLNLSVLPAGDMLVDCIASALSDGSDPTGQDAAGTLMPTSINQLELWLAGHSCIWKKPYDPAEVLGDSPKGAANRRRDVLRSMLSKAMDVSQLHAAKVLGAILRQHGIPDAELRAGAVGRRAQWLKLFRPADLARLKAGFRPSFPATTYTDLFDRADGSTLGSSWSTYLTSAEYGISSNKCIGGKASTWGSTLSETARYNSDVSSSDHWVTATIGSYVGVGSGDTWLGAAARFSGSANTCYYYAQITRSSSGSNRLDKIVSGTATNLGTASASNSDGDAVQCYPSGSSIIGKKNGTSQITVTDTSISGNTRGGLIYRSANYAVRPTYNDWSIDEAAGDTIVDAAGSSSMTLSVSGAAAAIFESAGSCSPAISASAVAETVAETAGSCTAVLSTSGAAEAVCESSGSSAFALSVSGTAESIAEASCTIDFVLSANAIAEAVVEVVGSCTFTLSVSGSVEAVAAADGAISCSLTVSGAAETVSEASGTSDFVLSTNAAAESIVEAAGSCAFTLSVSGSVEAVVAADGSISCSLTVSGAAETVSEASGTCTASLDVTGAAECTAETSGSCSASLSVTGAAEAVVEASGSCECSLSVTGDAATVLESTGSVACSLTASGVVESIAESVGAAAFTLTAAGVAEAYAEAAGQCAMTLTVVGVGIARNTRVAPDSIIYVTLTEVFTAPIRLKERHVINVTLYETHEVDVRIREIHQVAVQFHEIHLVSVEL